MRQRILVIISIVLTLLPSCTKRPEFMMEGTKTVINIIPKPQQLELMPAYFTINQETQIVLSEEDQDLVNIAGYLSDLFQRSTTWDVKIVRKNESPETNSIKLFLDRTYQAGSEAYELMMNSGEIVIRASAPQGIFYGVQSLRQLLPPAIESENGLVDQSEIRVQCVHIKDEPRFPWRGVMLDVSRHFFEVDFIKSLIDYLAYHKLNTFHWHLCDDQGWRIEIKKYPRLTEVGAWRVDRENLNWFARPQQQPGEQATYGGFYTQEQIRDVVAYARQRFVRIVPEIEMPGHTTAALAAYPEYSCTGGPFTVPPGSVWPITTIYCAGNDSAFEFLQDILTEVMDLFPGEYIHIGGDEVTKTNWESCPRCQTRIKVEGLKDELELQSYFVRRIETFLNTHGVSLIGWDEILEGGLAPRAIVMSWRGTEGGIEAARMGHDVVMSPVSHCYFNQYQGSMDQEPLAYTGHLPIRKVYEFNPIPSELTRRGASHILGGQANLWAEYVPIPEIAEYLLIPRMDALCEVLWTKEAGHDWNEFSQRLLHQFERYDHLGINYSRSAMDISVATEVDSTYKQLFVTLNSEIPQIEIRYTLDESEPTINSLLYTAPIEINSDVHLRAASFIDGARVSPVINKKFEFHLATGKKVTLARPNARKYDGGGDYALTNSLRGSLNFTDGRWKGFQEIDFEAIVDLEKIQAISSIGVGFLCDHKDWIFLPQSVEFAISQDGESFEIVDAEVLPNVSPEDQQEIVEITAALHSKEARFIRVQAKNIGKCPAWHAGAGEKAWLFVDEIVVK